MDANPNCRLCKGTGSITTEQAGIGGGATLGNRVACFRCWFGMDETPVPPTTVTKIRVRETPPDDDTPDEAA